MSFDLRLPIGLLFAFLGALLVVYGLLSDPAMYREHSLGININALWGAALFLFGVVMLALSLRTSRTPSGRGQD